MEHRLTYRRSGYVSDFTRFIDGYLQTIPKCGKASAAAGASGGSAPPTCTNWN